MGKHKCLKSPKQKIICENCKEPFYVYPSKIRQHKSDLWFCCQSCRHEYKKKTGEGMVEVVCKNCGKTLERYKCAIRGKSTFCSQNCVFEYRKENRMGATNRKMGGGITMCEDVFVCKNCNKNFFKSQTQVNQSVRNGHVITYCSKKCEVEYRRLHPESNWNYNPDRSSLKKAKIARSSNDMTRWRNAVYKRDGYTCQICGNKRKGQVVKINAHHIKTFIKYPESRFDVKNGITLCKKCHVATLKREEDFEELFSSIVAKKTIVIDPPNREGFLIQGG